MSSAVAPESGRAAVSGTPYKGLTPYGEEDAPLFFGRDVWSDIVTDNIKAYRLTLLYGESGVGKSSVLRAGVAHRLHAQAARNRESDGSSGMAVVVFGSWRGNVEQALVAALDAAAEGAGATNGHGGATEATLEAAVERCAERCGGRVFLILDQFEEYFVYHPAGSEGDGFDAALPRALRRRELPLNVLISIREDAVARLDRFKSRIPNLFDNYLRLDHLDRAAAREAIERPLEGVGDPRHGARIEPELVEAVLDEVQAGTLEVAQGGAIRVGGTGREVETPYLQLVMTRLWAEEQSAGSDVLRLNTLKALGGAQGIVSTHLGDAMESLPPEQRDVAARAFRYLVTRSRSKIAHSVSDLADWTEVSPEEMALVLERLCSGDARILRPVGESSYEIYHDVLADAILAWRAAHEAARRVEEEKRVSDAAKRRRVARIALVVGLLAFAVVALLAVLANKERNKANKQKRIANEQRSIADAQRKLASSRELAARSIQKGAADADLGIWLAVAAWDRSPTNEAKTALRTALQRSPVRPPKRLDVAGSASYPYASYSSDGERILTASETGPVELWDTHTLQRVGTVQVNPHDSAGGWQLSGDGSRVVTASHDRVRIFSAENGKVLASAKTPGGDLSRLTVNPSGTLVAAPVRRGRIGVWSVRSKRRVGTLVGRRPVQNASFATESNRLITYRPARDLHGLWLDIWRPSGRRIATVRLPDRELSALSGDGRRAFLSGSKEPPRLVDVDSRGTIGRGIRRLGKGAHGEFTDGSRYLATVLRSSATLWDARTGRRLREHHFGLPVQSVNATRDGKAAVVVLRGGVMRLWDTGAGDTAVVSRSSSRLDDLYSGVQIRRDGRQMLTQGYGVGPGVWDLEKVGKTGRVVLGDERASIQAAALDPRGRLLATATYRGPVRFWNPHKEHALGSSRAAGRRGVAALAFDPTGRRLAGGGGDGTAVVWDVATRRRVATIHTGRVALTDVALSRGGDRLATADAKGKAMIWPADGGKALTVIRAGGGRLYSVQFSPDGRKLLTASGGRARIWNAASGRLLVRLDRRRRKHSLPFDYFFETSPAASFSPDGSRVVMLGTDLGLRLWDADGTLLREVFGGTDTSINHATFSRDSALLAVARGDGTVRLLDARTGGKRGRLRVGGAQLYRVGFSPDGTKLAAMDYDGLTYVWDVRSHARLALIQGHEPFTFYRAEFTPDGSQIMTSDGDGQVAFQSCVVCLTAEQMLPRVARGALRPLRQAEIRRYHLSRADVERIVRGTKFG